MTQAGFAPVVDGESWVLILGSFPSVMSRKEGFYYGNPQNRFWRMLSAFFGRPLPRSVAEKEALLHAEGIALWDMVAVCEVEGSADASIRDERVVDLQEVLRAPIRAILCNGSKAYELLKAHFPSLLGMTEKLPSTSPANPRYEERLWHEALRRALADDAFFTMPKKS